MSHGGDGMYGTTRHETMLGGVVKGVDREKSKAVSFFGSTAKETEDFHKIVKELEVEINRYKRNNRLRLEPNIPRTLSATKMLFSLTNYKSSRVCSVLKPLIDELVIAAYSNLPINYEPNAFREVAEESRAISKLDDEQDVLSMLPYFELVQRLKKTIKTRKERIAMLEAEYEKKKQARNKLIDDLMNLEDHGQNMFVFLRAIEYRRRDLLTTAFRCWRDNVRMIKLHGNKLAHHVVQCKRTSLHKQLVRLCFKHWQATCSSKKWRQLRPEVKLLEQTEQAFQKQIKELDDYVRDGAIRLKCMMYERDRTKAACPKIKEIIRKMEMEKARGDPLNFPDVSRQALEIVKVSLDFLRSECQDSIKLYRHDPLAIMKIIFQPEEQSSQGGTKTEEASEAGGIEVDGLTQPHHWVIDEVLKLPPQVRAPHVQYARRSPTALSHQFMYNAGRGMENKLVYVAHHLDKLEIALLFNF